MLFFIFTHYYKSSRIIIDLSALYWLDIFVACKKVLAVKGSSLLFVANYLVLIEIFIRLLHIDSFMLAQPSSRAAKSCFERTFFFFFSSQKFYIKFTS